MLRATSEEDGALAYCGAELEGPVRTTDESPLSAASAAPGTPRLWSVAPAVRAGHRSKPVPREAGSLERILNPRVPPPPPAPKCLRRSSAKPRALEMSYSHQRHGSPTLRLRSVCFCLRIPCRSPGNAPLPAAHTHDNDLLADLTLSLSQRLNGSDALVTHRDPLLQHVGPRGLTKGTAAPGASEQPAPGQVEAELRAVSTLSCPGPCFSPWGTQQPARQPHGTCPEQQLQEVGRLCWCPHSGCRAGNPKGPGGGQHELPRRSH